MDCRLERLYLYFAFACFSFIAILNVRIYFEDGKVRKPQQINKIPSNDLRENNIFKTKIHKKSSKLNEKCQKYFPTVIQPKNISIHDIKKMFSNKTGGWVDNNHGIFYCLMQGDQRPRPRTGRTLKWPPEAGPQAQRRETCDISRIRHVTARHEVVRTNTGFFRDFLLRFQPKKWTIK